jgi:hypothetical protein
MQMSSAPSRGAGHWFGPLRRTGGRRFDQMMEELGEKSFKTNWLFETPALERRDELRTMLDE